MGNRKKNPPKYSENDMEQAVHDVRSKKLSLRKAAEKLGIAPNSLKKRVNGTIPIKGMKETRGRPTVITPKEETELADYLRTLAKWGFGLSRSEVMITVSKYCIENNIKTPFKNNVPGKDWFTSFKKRHNLELKNPETLEKNRLKNTADPFLVYEFYDLLESTVNELGIQADSLSQHLFNLDEVGVSHDPSKTKMVGGAEQKGLHRTIQGSGKENTTVMATVCANGELLPPLFIFKAAKLWSSWRGDCDIPGTFYAVSANGFITTEIFYQYLVKFTDTVTIRPLILVLDGHVSHLDMKVINKAKEENITILKLPSHTTDLLQPLDRACFAPFKTKYDSSLMTWQRENQRTLTKCEFVNLVCSVWREGISALNIISGFKACGISPVDRNKYPISRLNPEKLQRYLELKEQRAAQATTEDSSPSSAPCTESTLEEENFTVSSDSDSFFTTDNPSSDTNVDPILGSVPSQEELGQSQYPHQNNDVIILPLDSTSGGIEITEDASNRKTSFEDLLLKKISATKPKITERRMIHSNSAVITSEEYLSKINDLAAAKKPKRKGNAKNTEEQDNTSNRKRKGPETSGGKENAVPQKKKRAPRANAKKGEKNNSDTNQEVLINLENEEETSSVPPVLEEDEDTNFTDNDYALISYNNSRAVAFIQCVLPGLDEAIVLRLKQVCEEPQTYENDAPCTIKSSDLIRKLKSPSMLIKDGTIHYVFDSI
ncbi:hypothetical protein FOCC_FOCC007576 [Frankliniella occidentalis]|nr:hypothetical protein FOCC_FOCC007576 [Frankliniella occidentalis]